jgi:hypothetical protein
MKAAGVVTLVMLVAFPAWAQDASGPPPPTTSGESAGPEVHELLPEIGLIGAEVGAVAGASWNPYEGGGGAFLAGFIDLPLRRLGGGKLSYEIWLGLSLARSDAFALGPPPGTFGPTRLVESRLRLLHAAPFSLKYAVTRFDAVRLRPYLTAGVDVLLSDVRTEPATGRPSELEARGVPVGDLGLALGGHGGAGVEVRVARGFSLNLDYRIAAFEGRNARLQTLGAALGLHW